MAAKQKRQYRGAIPYKDAIQWMLDNDDILWLTEHDFEESGEPLISVTACLVADIYGRTNEEVIKDMLEQIDNPIVIDA